MEKDDAEELTQSLGQIMSGSWRQIAQFERMGVPKALGFASTREWVHQRLGGYVRLSVDERREAVRELAGEGLSQRAIGEVIGVDESTVRADRRAGNPAPESSKVAGYHEFESAAAGNPAPAEKRTEPDQPPNPTFTARKAGEDARKAILEAPADPEILPGVYVEDFFTGSDRIAEIDENLIRSELTPTEEAEHLQRRKEIWEAMREGDNNGATCTETPGRPEGFAKSTEEATGKTKNATNRATRRAREEPFVNQSACIEADGVLV